MGERPASGQRLCGRPQCRWRYRHHATSEHCWATSFTRVDLEIDPAAARSGLTHEITSIGCTGEPPPQHAPWPVFRRCGAGLVTRRRDRQSRVALANAALDSLPRPPVPAETPRVPVAGALVDEPTPNALHPLTVVQDPGAPRRFSGRGVDPAAAPRRWWWLWLPQLRAIGARTGAERDATVPVAGTGRPAARRSARSRARRVLPHGETAAVRRRGVSTPRRSPHD